MKPKFITCAVCPFEQQRATGQRYRPYFGKCCRCGVKLAVSDEVNQQQDADRDMQLICPQCTDSHYLENQQ